jgi:hypothetical protein
MQGSRGSETGPLLPIGSLSNLAQPARSAPARRGSLDSVYAPRCLTAADVRHAPGKGAFLET